MQLGVTEISQFSGGRLRISWNLKDLLVRAYEYFTAYEETFKTDDKVNDHGSRGKP